MNANTTDWRGSGKYGGFDHFRAKNLPIYKRPPPKASAGKLEKLIGIIVLAVIWHVGVAVIEYYRRHERDRPSLVKLLLLAEVEVLRALRAELKRRHLHKRERQHKRKLSEVEERLEELGEDGERVDI